MARGHDSGVKLTCGVSPCQVELGQPKVAELHVAFGVVKDVVRLEVPMDDALRVDMSQACQCLSYDLQPPLQPSPSLLPWVLPNNEAIMREWPMRVL